MTWPQRRWCPRTTSMTGLWGPDGPTCQRAPLGAQSAPSAFPAPPVSERPSVLSQHPAPPPPPRTPPPSLIWLLPPPSDGGLLRREGASSLALLALLNWAGLARLSLLAEDGGGAIERRRAGGRPRRDGEGSDISLPPFPLPLPRGFLGECLLLEVDDGRADGRALFTFSRRSFSPSR
ncbi:hypothetical protein GQ55_6G081300 [Panicum hallii var. hallii]|uniref:Uncharacterized protein n=1 Tax=Panicum hallii var. hallii TaxID=1504633 RepID=A0A2T7D5A9_9POAL|nr:hypothetical protein GQ55_6G081300 [Panicum hallii var. hallii]